MKARYLVLTLIVSASFLGRAAAQSADTWIATETTDAPTGRGYHSAVWTGSEMVIWGGAFNFSVPLDTGGSYDPVNETWALISSDGAPSPRMHHSTVWTGSEMIVWGGGLTATDSGGRYDPEAETWADTETNGSPTPRYYHTAVWTGSEMIVWGGWNSSAYVQDGARYNPVDDTWSPMSTDGAPSPRGRHTAVWTGSEMIVWGGYSTDGIGGETYHSSGARYDPLTDTWVGMAAAGGPSSRREHTAIWTGSEMVVWGGFEGSDNLSSGGRFDPATNTWKATRTSGAPSGRQDHVSIWTGSEMIIWGGFREPTTYCSTGARYLPEANRWLATSQTDVPRRRRWHSGVWTGSEMIVWGGRFQDYSSNEWLNDGAIFLPGEWVPVAMFPFHEDFEAQSLADHWEASTIGGGRVNLSTSLPYAGLAAVELREVSGYLTSSAELILQIDLSGRDDVLLDFWWYEIGDDFYLGDGVHLSDDYGESWVSVLSFAGGVSSYQNEIIDIDAAATANGLGLNDHFQIKFEFFDNNYITVYEGYVLDEVTVRTEALPMLTVDRSGTGDGVLTSDPAGISCPGDCSESYAHFSEITLSATADGTSTFVGWSGDSDCSDGQLTLLGDVTCTAVFETTEPPLFADGFEFGNTLAWSLVEP